MSGSWIKKFRCASPWFQLTTDEAAMMCVERKPAKHAVLFQAPHEGGIIKAMAAWAGSVRKTASVEPTFELNIQKLDPNKIAKALMHGIPQYANVKFDSNRFVSAVSGPPPT